MLRPVTVSFRTKVKVYITSAGSVFEGVEDARPLADFPDAGVARRGFLLLLGAVDRVFTSESGALSPERGVGAVLGAAEPSVLIRDAGVARLFALVTNLLLLGSTFM